MAIEIGNSNLRQQGMDMGLSSVNATMAVPFMWFTPATCDAWSPPVIMIIEALQSRLRQLGYPNSGTGFVDKATERALAKIVGRTWKNQPWTTIYRAVLAHTGGTMSYGQSMGDAPPLLSMPAGGAYGSLGLVETTWCSDKNPQGNCSPLRGICKPMDVPTLNMIKDLQRAMNRILASRKESLLDVDGRVGPVTTKKVNTVFPGHADCNAVMANLETLVPAITSMAAALPAVKDPPPKPGNPPSMALPSGGVYNPPIQQGGVTQIFNFVKTPMGLALVAAGVAVYMATRGPKKKTARKKPTRRRTTRRRPKRTISYRYY